MKRRIVFALIMSLVTTGIISFTLVSLNLGLPKGFLIIWLRSWSVAYVLAVVSVIFIGPRIQLLVDHLLRKKSFSKSQ